jgi:hypothetical protein
MMETLVHHLSFYATVTVRRNVQWQEGIALFLREQRERSVLSFLPAESGVFHDHTSNRKYAKHILAEATH